MTVRHRARGLALAVCALIAGAAATAAPAHHNEIDHRTNKYTWHFDYGITSGMHDALINGALVWDNVPSQCHDFQRFTVRHRSRSNAGTSTGSEGSLPSQATRTIRSRTTTARRGI